MSCSHLPLPRDAVLPDFGNGGLYGLARNLHAWLRDAKRSPFSLSAQEGTRHLVVLLVIDGLGDCFLQRYGKASEILRMRQGRLTSVFPSTTASAVTTLLSGLSPAEHGLTGWYIHDRRFGGVIAPLPLHRRGGHRLRAPFLTQRLFPYPGMFVGSRRLAAMVTPREIAFSPFSLRHARGAQILPYSSPGEFISRIVESAKAFSECGGLVHAYYPDFDAICHEFGAHSIEAMSEFALIDRVFAELLDRLGGLSATVVLTADHGFIDAPDARHIRLEAHPEAQAMLATPLFGERRVAFCTVRTGAAGDFHAYMRAHLRGRAVVAESAQLLKAGLLGPGRAHRRLAERVGTHALLMEPGWTISDCVTGESAHHMIGVHGGLTGEEMWVPLIQVNP